MEQTSLQWELVNFLTRRCGWLRGESSGRSWEVKGLPWVSVTVNGWSRLQNEVPCSLSDSSGSILWLVFVHYCLTKPWYCLFLVKCPPWKVIFSQLIWWMLETEQLFILNCFHFSTVLSLPPNHIPPSPRLVRICDLCHPVWPLIWEDSLTSLVTIYTAIHFWSAPFPLNSLSKGSSHFFFWDFQLLNDSERAQ